MMIRRLFVGLACAGTLAAQTIIQISDPQFGVFTKNASFEHEAVDLEFAIASANRPRRPGGSVRTADALAKEQAGLRRTVAVDGRSEVVHLTGSPHVGLWLDSACPVMGSLNHSDAALGSYKESS